MLPLSGVRILTVEQYGAGPFGSMMLADMGAEVIKIEDPGAGGDMSRGVGPFFMEDGSSQFFHSFNRNKRSLAVNLKTTAGRGVFEKLVATSDAVMNNLRGNQPAKLGLDYATLGEIKTDRSVCFCASRRSPDFSHSAWNNLPYA